MLFRKILKAFSLLGNRIVKITYDKFHIAIKKNEEEADEYDSEKQEGELQLMDKVLKNITGSTITADKNGKLISNTGAKAISDKVIAALPDYNDGSNETIKNQLENFIGDKFVTDNIVQNLTLIPDSALAIGNTWTKHTDFVGEIPISTTVTYALEKVEDGIGIVHSSADFKNVIDKTISLLGITTTADLKGTIKGDYKILEKSGFLISAASETKITGTINVSNKDVPVSIIIKKILRLVS